AARIEEYAVVDLVWEVQMTPDSPSVFVNGTVQDLDRQLSKINANYKQEYHIRQPTLRQSKFYRTTDRSAGQDPINCRMGSDWTSSIGRILDGVTYLRSLHRDINIDSGFRQCSRVSCSWNSGIFLCNNVSAVEITCWQSQA
ncbi:hypothetical protein V8F20_011202, partial [Naviculisporaceae sp. PSN 640]